MSEEDLFYMGIMHARENKFVFDLEKMSARDILSMHSNLHMLQYNTTQEPLTEQEIIDLKVRSFEEDGKK